MKNKKKNNWQWKKIKKYLWPALYSASFHGLWGERGKRNVRLVAWKVNTSHAGTFPPKWATQEKAPWRAAHKPPPIYSWDGGPSCWFWAMHFDRKEGVVSLFATTLGGVLWYASSFAHKTDGLVDLGLSSARPLGSQWTVCKLQACPYGSQGCRGASSKYGTSKSNLLIFQIAVDGESVRRSLKAAPH